MAERTYRIHVAAELSGVRVELIRAWERRYGVLQPLRTPAGYRVYTERDVAVLKRLKKLTDEGVAISEAAKLLPQLLSELTTTPAANGDVHGSGAALAFWRDAALLAAEAYDQGGVSTVVDDVLSALPPLKAFEGVLAPLQREVGERWHLGELSVAQEHLVTQVVRARLVSLLHSAPEGGRRHAVLACFPDEEHELGLLGVALRLRHAGFRVTLLGQRVPAGDLGRAVARLRPELVGLSAVTDSGKDVFRDTLSQLMRALPEDLPVWVGGAAAVTHADTVARLGARLFSDDRDWERLLEEP
ncbi:MerR family transcriptional regulator [Myxococcus landrumensis]|uniref:MerR family transcriptional regulator n=1 Tax=Myxococcus landrumensis TaxID=2813577 RepID=A0ABX7N3W6_9BACT|nr:MerR family transcriptional regulator [Myxococcus landrumus]QSQ11093.1 MerR family transcriptional regulator [Myxococcus landrumus]